MIFETNDLGIHNYTLVLILMLPIISTAVSVSRHIIGIKSLSLYAPIVLAYALIEMGMNRQDEQFNPLIGLVYGLIFYVVVLLISSALYRLMKRLRINYYSKMSLIFSGIASVVIIIYFLAAVLGDRNLANVNIFSVVLIAAIAERLVAHYARTDFTSTFLLSLETFAIALFGLFIFTIPQLQNILISKPWVILILIIINFVVGSFRGLRLTEYWRFRSILNKADPQK